MTTPQDPDDGTTPQDPSDPRNPYAPPPPATPPPTTPPGPPATPPPPPVVPPAASPYGQPQDPAYVQPQEPAYSPPQQPGHPQPAYPPYGPVAPVEPGRGMAITALVLAILGCTCISVLVAVPLAIIVLVRGRDGRNHGKGLAIAALVVSALWVIGFVIGGAAVYNYAKDLKSPNDLQVGDCITADHLTDANADQVGAIRIVACSDDHDGEVASTVELTKVTAQANAGQLRALCVAQVGPGYVDEIANTATYGVVALTPVNTSAGDKDVCVVYRGDGSQLTGKLAS